MNYKTKMSESCNNIVENIKYIIDENKKINNEILKIKNSLTNIQAKEFKIYEQLSKNQGLRNQIVHTFPMHINDQVVLDQKIKQAYELAILRTKKFGFLWHVDHIIPLNGVNVSGLHVIENIQVIPAAENLLKNNKYEIEHA